MSAQSQIETLLESALSALQMGQLEQVKLICDNILKSNPEQPDALHLIGVMMHQRGEHKEAINIVQRALSRKTSNPSYYNTLGISYSALEKYNEAIENLKLAIQLNRNHGAFWNNLATALLKVGKFNESIEASLEAIRLDRKDSRAYVNMGFALKESGKPEKAVEFYEKAIEINPHNYEAHLNLGNLYKTMGQIKMAFSSYREAIKLNPGESEVHNNLGVVLKAEGKIEEAVISYERALAINPNYAVAHNNLGSVLITQGKLDEAVASFRRTLAINPNYSEALNNMGVAFVIQGKMEEAVISYRRALENDQDNVEAHNNLGMALHEQGENAEAISSIKHALAIKPTFAQAHSNILFVMNYDPEQSLEILYKEHCNWAENHVSPFQNVSVSFPNDKDPEKRLRIGYVSSDFRNHSVAFFIEPILAHHNQDQFEIFCYSTVNNPDETTQRLRGMVEHWRSIVGLNEENVEECIRNDGIDILVDLSGHTANNSLLVFARKPAPVQVSYLGYPNTTGMPEMDYRLTDANADPTGTAEKWYTEKLVWLEPTAWCYRPMEITLPVSELPASKKGKITFGSFNTFPKLHDNVIMLWGRILEEVAEANLFLKAKSLAYPSVKEKVMNRFKEIGISEERIRLGSYESSYKCHLERYHEVDIALDPYPYNGTTTTCEALFMGLPVITLKGEAHRSRVGVSLLKQVGLDHLIAKTPEEYVDIAKLLATDRGALATLRKCLRTRMQNSALMDETGFTKKLEATYREIWNKWVRG